MESTIIPASKSASENGIKNNQGIHKFNVHKTPVLYKRDIEETSTLLFNNH